MFTFAGHFFWKGKERGNIISISQPSYSSPRNQLQQLSKFCFLSQVLIPGSLPGQTEWQGGDTYAGGQGCQEDWLCRNLIWHSISSKSKSCPLDGSNSCNCRMGWGAGPGSPAWLNLSQQPISATLANAPRAEWNGAWARKMEHGQKADRPHHSPFPQHLLCHLYNAAVSSLVSHSTGKTLINWSKWRITRMFTIGDPELDHPACSAWRTVLQLGFVFFFLVGVFFLVFLKDKRSLSFKRNMPLCG